MKKSDLIAEARRLEDDYGDCLEVMTHMSVLADALEAAEKEIERIDYHRGHWKDEFEALEAATRVPVQGEGYTVEVDGQHFTQAQWEAVQRYCGGSQAVQGEPNEGGSVE